MPGIRSHTTQIRVRYYETDAMGYLHHGQYPGYVEVARTELFRLNGGNYREMEEQGLFFVISQMSFRFRKPAVYDDILDVTATLEKLGAAKMVHSYQIRRGDELLAEGETTIALVDAEGQVKRLSAELISGLSEEDLP